MNSIHLVDPELRSAFEHLKAFDDNYSLENLAHLRAKMKDMYAQLAANLPAVPDIERLEI